MRIRQVVLAAILLLAAFGIAVAAPVKIASGLVEGSETGGITVYKGIPFAGPTGGAQRWKPPTPAPHWQGVKKADTFAPQCVQPKSPIADPIPQSEDCLYLNLWTPAKSADAKLPVMVWIHGGGFSGGSPSSAVLWGDHLAKKGVVVVNITYRLGPLGFLAHPALTAESANHSSGNYALLDLIAGLKWVKENVAAFGGDPAKVTIFGESAGSIAVHLLTVSPLARGLFVGAIGESGAAMTPTVVPDGLRDLKTAEAAGAAFAKAKGADSIAALRALSTDKLLEANPQQTGGAPGGGVGWPIIDGWVIPQAPYEVFSAGRQFDVPILIGTNHIEGALFTRNAPGGAAEFKASVAKQYGDFAPRILKLYPASDDAEAKTSRALLAGDTLFGWNNWTWARLQSKTGKGKVYYYHFEHAPPADPSSPFPSLGATHFAEVAYVFGNPGKAPWTDYDRKLSDQMSSYWTNFAKTGDPNGPGLPNWPAFNQKNDAVMHLGDKVAAGGVEYKEKLELLDAYFAKSR